MESRGISYLFGNSIETVLYYIESKISEMFQIEVIYNIRQRLIKKTITIIYDKIMISVTWRVKSRSFI